MLKGFMSKDTKQLDEYKLRVEALSSQNRALYLKNSALTDEIHVLYQLLVQKDASILSLRKLIIEQLNMPEYQGSTLLETELNQIFQKQDYYDPRKYLHKEIPKQPASQEISQTKEEENSIDLMNDDQHPNLEKELLEYGFQGKDAKSVNSVDGQKEAGSQEITQGGENNPPKSQNKKEDRGFDNKAMPFSGLEPEDKRIALAKMKEERRSLIKNRDADTVARELFVFELELKEYSYPVFEAIKEFVTQPDLTGEDIHDEIDRLADNMMKIKYFKTVFPKDTKERLCYELENYIFEILFPKLFIVDEDGKAFAIQLKDRLNVLKQLVSFEMLDVPVPLRKEKIFTFAIKEFQKMNLYKSPILKLKVFQNCANHLIDMFLELVERNPNSDELFPLFLYTVLHANSDFLKLNADYIFMNLRRSLKLGQEGFLIANLKAVIKFLGELDGASLKDGKLEIKDPSKLYA